MNELSKRASRKATVVICFIYSGISADALMMPAMATVAAAFPELPFSTVLLIATLPSLLAIPMALLSGKITPRYISYKAMLVISLLLYAIAGTAPVLLNDFGIIMACRCIFGIAFGCLYPIGNALVLQLFTGSKRAKLLGRGNSCMNLGVVCMQLSAGFLAAIGWNYVFLAHLYALVVLVVVLLFFKEPKEYSTPSPEENAAATSLRAVPTKAWALLILFTLTMVAVATVFYSISGIIENESMGSPIYAGFASVIDEIAGALAGLVFLRFTNVFKRYTVSAGMLIAVIGMIIIGFAKTYIVLCVGAFILGVGFINITSGVTWQLGLVVSSSQSMLISSLQAAFMQFGNFLCTPFIGIIDSFVTDATPQLYVFAAAGLLAICCLALCVVTRLQKPIHKLN